MGDYITDCPYPNKTIHLIKETMKKYKAWAVRGNREDYIINHRKSSTKDWTFSSATGALLFTYENLSEENLGFLESLPISCMIDIPDCKPLHACHATIENTRVLLKPNTDFTDKYMEQFNGEYLLVGHTHKPFTYKINGKTLINPGSVGCPTNSQTKSQFVALEFIGNEWVDTLISVEYDIEKIIFAFHESSILEKSRVWGYSMIKLLKTGVNYPVMIITRANELAKADSLSTPTETHWHQAAKELDVI